MNGTANYHAFLLRLWREDDAGSWRLMLEESDTGERMVFADVEGLCRFLLAATERQPPEANDDNDLWTLDLA